MTVKLTDQSAELLHTMIEADMERVSGHPTGAVRDRKLARLQALRDQFGRRLVCANEKCSAEFFTTRPDKTYCEPRCSDAQKQREIRKREKARCG